MPVIVVRIHVCIADCWPRPLQDMMSLRHPNIATVMGIVEDERTPLLVMEYMHHRSLSQLLENETVALEPETTHSIARDIACGMLYLHSHEPPVLHTGLSCGEHLPQTACISTTEVSDQLNAPSFPALNLAHAIFLINMSRSQSPHMRPACL